MELDRPRDLEKILDNENYVRWRQFRRSEDSSYVCLVLPRILLRRPYGRDGQAVEAFAFEEGVDGRDHTKYLWGNAAYALAAVLTNAFDRYGWCAKIRGVEGGGLVTDLPTHTFYSDDGDVIAKCPTEVSITDRREKELADLGFTALVHYRNGDFAAFFSVRSCRKPTLYVEDIANANARLLAELQYTLTLSRFSQYVKSMLRDTIGTFRSRKECEDRVNKWLAGYVSPDEPSDPETAAKFPLRAATAEIVEAPGRPGFYKAVLFLRPSFQVEEPSVSLRVVTDLPQPAK